MGKKARYYKIGEELKLALMQVVWKNVNGRLIELHVRRGTAVGVVGLNDACWARKMIYAVRVLRGKDKGEEMLVREWMLEE